MVTLRPWLLAALFYVTILSLYNQTIAMVYNVTPHDVGSPGAVEVTGGTLTTDGTTGSGLTLGSVLTSWSIDLKNGAATQTLTPSNSNVQTNSAALFNITNTDITFAANIVGVGATFSIRNPTTTASYHWKDSMQTFGPPTPSALSIRFGSGVPILETTSPAPGAIGNVARIPEPASFGLLSLGVGFMAGFGRRPILP